MAKCWFCYNETENEKEYHERCSKKFFGTNEVPQLELDEKVLHELAEKSVNQKIAVTGVQPKLSLTLEKQKGKPRLTIVGLWGEYILKPQHPNFPFMPQTEDLTMHLASLFKIEVCEHALIRSTAGELVYVAKRFDRVNGKKTHVEDFCQLSELLTENKYKSSYEKAGKVVLKYCTNEKLDAVNYFELLVFCFLTGNNDMHLKNFSLLHKDHGSVALSPAYDLLNVSLLNPADNEELALTLNAKKRKIKKADFESLGNMLGLNTKVQDNVFKKFVSNNTKIQDFISKSFLTEEYKEKYWQIFLAKQKVFL